MINIFKTRQTFKKLSGLFRFCTHPLDNSVTIPSFVLQYTGILFKKIIKVKSKKKEYLEKHVIMVKADNI